MKFRSRKIADFEVNPSVLEVIAEEYCENEHDKRWSIRPKSYIERLFHDQKSFGPDGPGEAYKQDMRDELDSIMALGRREYEYEPAPSWYSNG